MIHLACLPPGARPSHTELARAVECPEQFLSKVLQRLTHAGLIVSHRGKAGGFELRDTRRQTTTVLEVVEVIEGPLRLNLCLESANSCERQHWCPAHAVWAEGQAALVKILRSATIASLAHQTPAARLSLEGVPVWK